MYTYRLSSRPNITDGYRINAQYHKESRERTEPPDFVSQSHVVESFSTSGRFCIQPSLFLTYKNTRIIKIRIKCTTYIHIYDKNIHPPPYFPVFAFFDCGVCVFSLSVCGGVWGVEIPLFFLIAALIAFAWSVMACGLAWMPSFRRSQCVV